MDLFNLEHLIYSICLIIYTIGFFFALRQQPSEGQKIILVIEFLGFMMMLGYWGMVQNRNASEDELVFANKLQYISACTVYVVLLVLYLRFFQIHLPKFIYCIQLVFTAILTIIAVTFDKHHLYYKSYHVETINGVNTLVKEFGPFHTVFVVSVIVYTIAFTVLYLYTLNHSAKALRKNGTLLYIAILFPSICYLLEKILHLNGFRLVPFGLLITSFISFYIITVRNGFDVKELALSQVFNTVDDAIVVVDNKVRLEMYNTKAAELFPFLTNIKYEHPLSGNNAEFEKLFVPVFNRQGSFPEEYESKGKVYRSLIKYVYDETGSKQGIILSLQDVTAVHQNEISLQANKRVLEQMVANKTRNILDMQNQIISAFADLAAKRDIVTGKHLQRTSSYVFIIAETLKSEDKYSGIITNSWIETIQKVAPLHDIGKISVPDKILNKPGRLNKAEFDVIKKHTTDGARFINFTLKDCVGDDYYKIAEDIAQSHHEQWDGNGYPNKLKGTAIPLSARIMAVADVFDALVSKRPYKEALSPEQAFTIIQAESGTHFDPDIVNAFLENKEIILGVYEELQDDAGSLQDI